MKNKTAATATPTQGFVFWLLGPTSSGKTTIAKLLLQILRDRHTPVIHYDGDEVRNFFGKDLGFEPSDRLRVVSTLVQLANKASIAGINVIVSALTANVDARSFVNANTTNLLTGYVTCSVDTCAQRDPKGLYAQAKKGQIDTLIGFNSTYLPPGNPDIILETEKKSPDQSVAHIINYLKKMGKL